MPGAGEEDLRSFEWHYLRGLAEARSKEQLVCRHRHIVYAAIFSPDGKTIASGGADRSVWLWNSTTGECLAELRGHAYDVNSLSFSPDGRTLYTGGWDNAVRVWYVERLTERASFNWPIGSRVTALAVSSDGLRAAAGGDDGTVAVWDLD